LFELVTCACAFRSAAAAAEGPKPQRINYVQKKLPLSICCPVSSVVMGKKAKKQLKKKAKKQNQQEQPKRAPNSDSITAIFKVRSLLPGSNS
jgi:hypothetical protein